jgi:hypothetical protein
MKHFGLKLIREDSHFGNIEWTRWFKTQRDRDEAKASHEKKAKAPFPLVHKVETLER